MTTPDFEAEAMHMLGYIGDGEATVEECAAMLRTLYEAGQRDIRERAAVEVEELAIPPGTVEEFIEAVLECIRETPLVPATPGDKPVREDCGYCNGERRVLDNCGCYMTCPACKE